jgi:hypothetical protein
VPRTEKKFGQVKQAASGAATVLAPVAQTKRNALVNLSTRSTDTVVTVMTTTGAIGRSFTSGAISIGAPVTLGTAATVYTDQYGLPALYPAYEGLVVFQLSGNDLVSWNPGAGTFTKSQATGQIALGTPDSVNASYTTALATLSDGVIVPNVTNKVFSSINSNDPSTFTQSMKAFYVDNTADIRAAVISGYAYNQITGSNVLTVFYAYSTSANATYTVNSSGTGLVRNVGNVNTVKAWGLYNMRSRTSTAGVMYAMSGMTSSTATGTSSIEALGFNIFNQAGNIAKIWWSGGQAGNFSQIASFFAIQDYSASEACWAFSSSVQADNPWYGSNATAGTGTGFTTIMPYLPVGVAPAGFRIVKDDGTINTNRSFLDGTTLYPAAPTGVDVPTYAEHTAADYPSPIASIKFNPAGNRVAVAYNRSYSGTGNAKSVVVVYKKQNNGDWEFEAASGSAIAVPPTHEDCMTWLADGSGIAVTDSTNVYIWTCGFADVQKSLTISTVSSSMSGEYPPTPSMANAPVSGTFTLTNSGSTRALASTENVYEIWSESRGATLPPGLYVIKTRGGTSTNHGTSSFGESFSTLSYGVTGTVSNYVNTVAARMNVRAGEVVQLSNIVLDPGEGIYIEPETNGTIEAVAYGVEIT